MNILLNLLKFFLEEHNIYTDLLRALIKMDTTFLLFVLQKEDIEKDKLKKFEIAQFYGQTLNIQKTNIIEKV